jgi:hypothetical protein
MEYRKNNRNTIGEKHKNKKRGRIMAERRMFAKTIIDSDAFLDMPLSTQALYFHLSMRADDDGFINNPRKIQRMIGGADDDLKVLITKKFIIPFESGIVVIKHWKIHNYIQKDRYKETVYLEEKAMLETKGNKGYTLKNDECIQDVYIMDTQVRLELGKSKDSIEKEIYSPAKAELSIPYEEIKDLFNEICVSYPKIIKLNDSRKTTIKARYKEYKNNIEIFKELFTKAENSEFLKGNNDKGWSANFDWLLNPRNMIKVLEGNYNKNGGTNNAITKGSNKRDGSEFAEYD